MLACLFFESEDYKEGNSHGHGNVNTSSFNCARLSVTNTYAAAPPLWNFIVPTEIFCNAVYTVHQQQEPALRKPEQPATHTPAYCQHRFHVCFSMCG